MKKIYIPDKEEAERIIKETHRFNIKDKKGHIVGYLEVRINGFGMDNKVLNSINGKVEKIKNIFNLL
jgi:hypothetical protein